MNIELHNSVLSPCQRLTMTLTLNYTKGLQQCSRPIRLGRVVFQLVCAAFLSAPVSRSCGAMFMKHLEIIAPHTSPNFQLIYSRSAHFQDASVQKPVYLPLLRFCTRSYNTRIYIPAEIQLVKQLCKSLRGWTALPATLIVLTMATCSAATPPCRRRRHVYVYSTPVFSVINIQ